MTIGIRQLPLTRLHVRTVGIRKNEKPYASRSQRFCYDVRSMSGYLRALKSRIRIAVIYGGDKDAADSVIYRTVNPRPWKSYKAVAQDICTTLGKYGFQHVTLLPEDMHLGQRLKEEGIHLAWLNTAGVQGYNSVAHAAAMLEMLGIPYIGHNPHDAALLDNKYSFKRMLQSLGIKTAPYLLWHPSGGELDVRGESFRTAFGDYRGRFVVKPVSGRASLHIAVVESEEHVAQAARNVFRATHNAVLVEKYLPGREFCVAVCGSVTKSRGRFSQSPQPFAFSAVERSLEHYELIFTSMDVKAITDSRIRPIDENERALKEQLLQMARQLYRELNLGYLVRLDVRADAEGVLHVLEANPKPDLKCSTDGVGSVIAIGLREYALDYDDLILSLLADRLHHLFTYNPDCVAHLVAMLA